MVGRNLHSFWKEGQFEPVKLNNNKNGACCLICKNILKNTTKCRLIAHRNICNVNNTKSVEGEEEEITVLFEEDESDSSNNEDNADNDKLNKKILLMAQPPSDADDINKDLDKDNELIMEYETQSDGTLTPCSTPSTSCSLSQDSSRTSERNYTRYVSPKSTSKASSVSTHRKHKHSLKSSSHNVLKNFLDSVSSSQKERITKAIGEFFIGCNIPFSVIDSPFFKNMIHELRPAYSPPCSKTLSTTILNAIHEDVIKNDRKIISPESVMVIDGWKNSANNTKQVVTIIHSSEGEQAFIDAFDITGKPETGEELKRICDESVKIAEEKYNTRIYAVVSDNAANMKKMGRLNSSLIHSTCNSHTANLLAKDIIDKELASKATAILKEFKNTHLEKLVVENGGQKIKLPIDTRWCTYRDSFECLLKNLSIFKKLVAEGSNVKDEIAQTLFDNGFIRSIESTVEVQNPICKLINECQESSCNIADAVNQWILLTVPPEFEHFLSKRRNMALNIYSMSANYLHPKYKGELLTETQKDQVEEYLISALCGDGLSSLQEFRNNIGIFRSLQEKQILSPTTFWGLAERKHPQLAKYALKLFKIPASSAQLERVFSNWSFVHSDLRNRLSNDKSKKLLHCYYSLRLNTKLTWEEEDSEFE